MNQQEIKERFTELKDRMVEVKTHCDTLKSVFPKTSSAYRTVSTHTEALKIHQFIIEGSNPTNDQDMEELATHVRAYCKVMNVCITDLASDGSGKDEYIELVTDYKRLEKWYKNILDSHKVSAPKLSISPNPLSNFYIIADETSSSQPIKISNIGSGTMNWNAQLDPGTSGFITLSYTSGSLKGGKTDSININFDTRGVISGTTDTTNVTISATDSSGNPAIDGKATLLVKVFVTENLFLCVMEQHFQTNPNIIYETEALFDNKTLTLSNDEINTLTNSWQTVVDFVVKQPEPCSCLSTPQADLIILNKQLEELYDNIENYVTSK